MAVLFDANVLLLALHPDAPPPIDPATSLPLDHVSERIDYLLRRLSAAKTTVMIPSPVLTEVLCIAKSAQARLIQSLQRDPFVVVPFDTRAAIECADLLAFHFAQKGRQKGVPGARAKIKFDRQIVAIARANGASEVFSDDDDVRKEAMRVGLKVNRTIDLPRDPATAQGRIDLRPRDES